MSASVLAIVRSGYGSRWTATESPAACASWITSGSRRSSGEPHPHHELTTSWTPAAAISRICARTILGLELEYRPRAG